MLVKVKERFRDVVLKKIKEEEKKRLGALHGTLGMLVSISCAPVQNDRCLIEKCSCFKAHNFFFSPSECMLKLNICLKNITFEWYWIGSCTMRVCWYLNGKRQRVHLAVQFVVVVVIEMRIFTFETAIIALWRCVPRLGMCLFVGNDWINWKQIFRLICFLFYSHQWKYAETYRLLASARVHLSLSASAMLRSLFMPLALIKCFCLIDGFVFLLHINLVKCQVILFTVVRDCYAIDNFV